MRYLLFSGDFYYPGGGCDDLIGRYDTIEAALQDLPKRESSVDWAHVLGLDTFSQADVEWDADAKKWSVDVKWLSKGAGTAE